jgi:hypothetical protein
MSRTTTRPPDLPQIAAAAPGDPTNLHLLERLARAEAQNQRLRETIEELTRHQETREDIIRELARTLVEIKLLNGLLPICCACKKIRDDTGGWNVIESYISQHSEAQFTHGLCPDCEQQLYERHEATTGPGCG